MALKQGHKDDYDVHKSSISFWRKEYDKIEDKKRKLLDLITDGKISEAEFEEKKNDLECEQSVATDNLEEIEKVGNEWVEQQKNIAINCYNAFLVFTK